MSKDDVTLQMLLATAGLEGLEPLFSRQDIDMDVVTELNETDLRELGLTLGQRRRLQKALSGLNAAQGEDNHESAPPLHEPGTPSRAERRLVTVMFVDLVASTVLTQRHDPEQMSDILASAGGWRRAVRDRP